MHLLSYFSTYPYWATKPLDDALELHSIQVASNTQALNIVNIYVPPTDSIPRRYQLSLEYLNTLQYFLLE